LRARFFPAGTRYDYECGCKRSFSVHDSTSIAFAFVAGLVLSAVGALVIRFPPGSAIGAESSNRWVGVGLAVFGAVGWLMFAARVRGRIVHPEA
jgi:hypothetical protein